jgi:hypothetical protein
MRIKPIFNLRVLCLVVASVSLLASCSKVIEVKPIGKDSSEVEEGILFYLPKTLVEVKYNTFDKSVVDVNDKSVSVNTTVIPDVEQKFLLNPDDARGFFKDAEKMEIVVSDSGIMTDFNLTWKDKTHEVLTNLTKLAINVAEMTRGGDVPVDRTEIIDPSSLVFHQVGDKYFEAEGDIMDGTHSLRIVSPVNLNVVYSIDSNSVESLKGIPYRIPVPVKIQILKSNKVIHEYYKSFLQGGQFAFAPIRSGMFSDKTLTIQFQEGGGGMRKYSSVDTAVGEKALTAYSGTLNSVLEYENSKEKRGDDSNKEIASDPNNEEPKNEPWN